MVPRTSLRSRLVLHAVCALLMTTAAVQTLSAQATISYPLGFAGASGLTLNGSAALHGNAIELTDGKQFEAGSFFYNTRQQVASFETDFDFQLTNAVGDGFTFALQCDGQDALGSIGGLGLANDDDYHGDPFVAQNIAIAFGLHSNYGDSGNSLRLITDGYRYDDVQLGPSGINLHSGHPFHAHIAFIPEQGRGYMQITLTDTQTGVVYANTLPQPQYGGIPITLFLPESSAYVGFTAGSGVDTAIQSISDWTFTPLPVPDAIQSPGPSFVGGFAGATGLTFNGGAKIEGSALQLTNGTQFEATSAYFTEKLSPGIAFYTDFDFQIENGTGDGFTFVIQDQGLNAVGSSGGGLGYGPDRPGGTGPSIGNSVAVKFDTHNNAGEGSNSIGIYVNGASPTTPSVDLDTNPTYFGRNINLRSGHPFHVYITGFSPGYVNVEIVDLTDYTVGTVDYVFNDGTFASGSVFNPAEAYVGFTAGTGETPSTVKILNWTWIQGVDPASLQ